MITRAEVDAAAASWARSASLAEGRTNRAAVDEFDQGWAVRLLPDLAAGEVPDIGSGVTVIDRATARVSTWPNWPGPTLHRLYAENRADITDPIRTADPEVQLRRETYRAAAPSVAAHATVDGRVYVTRGAKGDQELRHHPLVYARMAELAPQDRIRGCERHAEVLACSDALHDVDRRRALDGRAPLTLDEARELLGASILETFLIQGPDDPLAGEPNTPCETCIHVLTQLAFLPWEATVLLQPVVAEDRPNPAVGRMSDALAAELLQGGWLPQISAADQSGLAELLVQDVVEVAGREYRHEAFPAVVAAYGHTGPAGVGRRAPGVDQRVRPFEIVSTNAAHTADLLHDFGRIIGARMFPLGRVAGESVLAIDEHGRVFDLDQAGEWFVGSTYLDALETLTQGLRTFRVRDDGTWPGGPPARTQPGGTTP